MPAQIVYPDPQLITEVISEFQPDPAEYMGLSKCPMETTAYNSSPKVISWDILGPGGGMTQPHALGTNPRMVKQTALKTKSMKTAYWKEFIRLDEADLLEVRNVGPRFQERAAETLVMRSVNRLDNRLFTRMEWLVWQMFNGTLSLNENGIIRTIDYEIPAGNQITVATLWSNPASDPISDIQGFAQVFSNLGTEIDEIWINMQTAINLCKNTILRDLVRQSSNVTRIGVGNVGALLMELAGVPGRIVIYDKGYLNDSLTFTRFIPNGRAHVFARQVASQGKFCEFACTPSLYNGGISGATGGRFVRTLDKTDDIHKAYYDIMMGLYGLPVMFHPEWVLKITC